jgi:formamidopyrimidine-DNA glycosylase
MPELPEVETIRRDLAKRILNKEIKSVEALDKKLGKAESFARILIGNEVFRADRVGKLLIFHLKSGSFLLIHLKMTGQLIFRSGEKIFAGGHSLSGKSLIEEVGGVLPNKHTRFIVSFAGGHKLFFNDLRRFGYVKIVDRGELEKIKGGYGIEPLSKAFTPDNLKNVLSGKRNIKAVLLDQTKISGIGNIYADEILFAARVRPSRRADSLKPAELKNIFSAAARIIKKAIEQRGTTFSDYVDSSGRHGNFIRFLKVYGRKGEKCQVCSGAVKVLKIAGRSTHFCPKCQK